VAFLVASTRTPPCTGPVKYIGQDAIGQDIANLKGALKDARCEAAFMTAVSPGCTANVFPNEYYGSKEDYLFALADALHEEYKAITDAGFTLQIDGPDLADSWQVNSGMTVDEYRKFAEVQTASLNHALRDSPPSQVRFQMCWGSWHGPHTQDISLADIADVMVTIRARDFSVEAANPRHELDWQVWEKVRLPEGKRLIPGVVGMRWTTWSLQSWSPTGSYATPTSSARRTWSPARTAAFHSFIRRSVGRSSPR
jgi:5-methyltetrahydropteroyltriglutamate--homocysteine methyltransferase